MQPATVKLLQKTQLFQGFSAPELARVLPPVSVGQRTYAKGQLLLHAGSGTQEIGILLAGSAEAVKTARTGAQLLVTRLKPGAVFGDVLAGSHAKSPVAITATAACRVLFLSYRRLLQFSAEDAPLGRRLLANLVAEISDKYFLLDDRLNLLLQKTIRKRVAAFLLGAGSEAGSAPFSIPFTRAALADYLGCERSALSREISRMAAEGLLEVQGRTFRLPAPEKLRAQL